MLFRNKKFLCFVLVMLFTLTSCCLVAAADNTDTITTTNTTNNEVTSTNTVEQTNTNTKDALTATSTGSFTQSEDNTIEETVDQNEVERKENKNAKAINKAKITEANVKTVSVNSWANFPTSGTADLTGNIIATSSKTITGNLIINGNGYSITGPSGTNLFTVNNAGTSITFNNVIVQNVGGYVVNGGSNHQFISSQFFNDHGIWKASQKIQNTNTLMTNCYFVNIGSNAFILDVKGSQFNDFEVYNVIFDGSCSVPIIATFQHSDFTGYNFIYADKVVINTSKVGTNYNTDLFINQDQFYGNTNSFPLAKHSQGNIDIETVSTDTRIMITCTPVVHINQTNNIRVKLNATVANRDVGVPFETVYITIRYADGS